MIKRLICWGSMRKNREKREDKLISSKNEKKRVIIFSCRCLDVAIKNNLFKAADYLIRNEFAKDPSRSLCKYNFFR